MIHVSIYLEKFEGALKGQERGSAIVAQTLTGMKKETAKKMPALTQAVETLARQEPRVAIMDRTEYGLHVKLMDEEAFDELRSALPRGWKPVVTDGVAMMYRPDGLRL